MSSEITRRTFLVGAGAGAAGLIGLRSARAEATVLTTAAAFKLSVTRWPFNKFTLDELSQMARAPGRATMRAGQSARADSLPSSRSRSGTA